MLVRQMNRMEYSIAAFRQSQTRQHTETPNIGEARTIKCDSFHASTDMALSGEVNQPQFGRENPVIQS